jgi:hypothetical protein
MEAFGPEAQPASEVSGRSKWAPGNADSFQLNQEIKVAVEARAMDLAIS